MKPVIIKRTRNDVPGMILLLIIALFPGLYFMYDSNMDSIGFIIAALYTILIIVIAVFAFKTIFKYHGSFILTKEGMRYRDNDGHKDSGDNFYKWEDINSYQIVTEKDRYFSNETNTYQENDKHFLVLALGNESAIRISADKLSKKPDEIIKLFDGFKKGR